MLERVVDIGTTACTRQVFLPNLNLLYNSIVGTLDLLIELEIGCFDKLS